MKVKLLASVALAGLFTAGAAAAEPNGWYGALDAGYNFWGDDVEARSEGLGQPLAIHVDDDWAAFARLGYRFDQNWRVELEGGYRAGEIEYIANSTTGAARICNVVPATGPCLAPDGEMNAASLMVNVLYDFGDDSWALRPFIGLGAGANRVNTEVLGTLASARTVGFGVDDSSTKLAAQGIAGLAWAISDRANMDLTYRYIVSNMEFDTFTSTTPTDQGNYLGRYEGVHTLTLGLRYAFGAEPAPPPPPPPPYVPPAVVTPPPRPVTPPPVVQTPVRREFIVYFDWDRSDLTAEAQSVVTQAANYAKSGRPTRILIVGHADTSGSAAYNVGLSNRRSRTVADALVGQGVNGGVISLDGKGETMPARATGDGVREPLNRRATIDINF
jgi:outer membrane protein OmpA-like peptidoglycan-associated protein/outer membrane protein W